MKLTQRDRRQQHSAAASTAKAGRLQPEAGLAAPHSSPRRPGGARCSSIARPQRLRLLVAQVVRVGQLPLAGARGLVEEVDEALRGGRLQAMEEGQEG